MSGEDPSKNNPRVRDSILSLSIIRTDSDSCCCPGSTPFTTDGEPRNQQIGPSTLESALRLSSSNCVRELNVRYMCQMRYKLVRFIFTFLVPSSVGRSVLKRADSHFVSGTIKCDEIALQQRINLWKLSKCYHFCSLTHTHAHRHSQRDFLRVQDVKWRGFEDGIVLVGRSWQTERLLADAESHKCCCLMAQ